MAFNVGYFIGSLSEESINRRFAEALVKLAPASLEFTEIPYSELPLYNRDLDKDYPEVALDFKKKIAAQDALLYVTPEYNRAIPGALKNAIDWASRPHGKGVLGKPSAIAGVAHGAIGTAVVQAQMRQMLGFFGAVLYTQPELYIQWKPELIQENGEFNPATKEFLQKWMDGFAAFVAKQVS